MELCTKCGGSGLSEPVTVLTPQPICSGCHGLGRYIKGHNGVLVSPQQALENSTREKMNKLKSVGMIQ